MLAGARRAAIALGVLPTNSDTGRYLLGFGCPVFNRRPPLITRRAGQRQPSFGQRSLAGVEPNFCGVLVPPLTASASRRKPGPTFQQLGSGQVGPGFRRDAGVE